MMMHRSKIGTHFMASRRRDGRFLFSTKPGTSLLVAMGLTTIIVLVSLGVTTVIISSIRDSANVTAATQSFYAAEGALEEGLLENQNKGIGYTAPTAPVVYGNGQSAVCKQQAILDTTKCFSLCDQNQNSPSCLSCVSQFCPSSTNSPVSASYTISGQVPESSKYMPDNVYGIPAPGTGNADASGQAGSVAGCDVLHPFTSGNFWFDTTKGKFFGTDPGGNGPVIEGEAIDHPCNWGKIKVGETVAIPLYYTCVQGDPSGCTPGPVNLFDASIQNQNLRIKLRTACKDGKIFCSYTDRPDLNTTNNGDPNYNYNDPIVSWEVSGQSQNGSKTYTLEPILAYDTSSIPPSWKNITSIFYEGLTKGINIFKGPGGGYEPFQNFLKTKQGVDPNGCQGIILKFLTNQNATSGCTPSTDWTNQDIKKPVLKLTVIHSLEDSNNDTIPYLEYQVLTENPSAPPTDVMQTITAEGYSGSFKQVLQVNVPQESGLPAYVIQQ